MNEWINNQQNALRCLLCILFATFTKFLPTCFGRNMLWIKYIINIEVHLIGYLYIMDLINPREMEHIKSSFEYYTAALTQVLSPSSILPPNSCRYSFGPERKIIACLSKMWFFIFFYFNCINAQNLPKSGSVHGLRHTVSSLTCMLK